MKIFLLIVGILFIFFLGAVTHERDIAISCRAKGHSGYAGWTVDIKCSEMQLFSTKNNYE